MVCLWVLVHCGWVSGTGHKRMKVNVHSILVDERERETEEDFHLSSSDWMILSFLMANANNASAMSDVPWALNKILINLKQ